jgi:hypothetical protein
VVALALVGYVLYNTSTMHNRPFSQDLETWLSSKEPKTIDRLVTVFAEKSFAMILLITMFLPSLPLPTGGITHVLELVAMLVCLEMIIGRRTIWLPARVRSIELGAAAQKKTIPFIVKRVRWFEKFSRPRWGSLLGQKHFLMFVGLTALGFTVAAFLSPPFSGLDTLPSLGVVIMALALILEDVYVLIIGWLVGLAGVALLVSLGAAIANFIGSLF